MNSKQYMEKWFAERVFRSAAPLVKALNDEAEFEMMGLPLEAVQAIHNRAIFELLVMVNTNGGSPRESEPQYDAFMEFISREFKGFVEMCLRMQKWNVEDPTHEAEDSARVPFRRNASRN